MKIKIYFDTDNKVDGKPKFSFEAVGSGNIADILMLEYNLAINFLDCLTDNEEASKIPMIINSHNKALDGACEEWFEQNIGRMVEDEEMLDIMRRTYDQCDDDEKKFIGDVLGEYMKMKGIHIEQV